MEITPEQALRLITQFGIRHIEPRDSHSGPRIRVNGDVVNELNDDEGFYAIVELPQDND